MRWQQYGDEAARNELIAAHKPMLKSIAERASRTKNDFHDLMQEAAIGFTIALDKYDVKHGIRLGTWAKYYAKKEARDFRLANCAPVRLPNSRRTKSIEWTVIPIIDWMEKTFDVSLTRTEKEMICLDEGFDITELDTYLSATSPAQFIGSFAEDESGTELAADDLEADVEANSPRVNEIVLETVQGLEERARYVVRRRYLCVETAQRPSLDVVAAELGISRERTGQVERAALSDLKVSLQKRGLALDDLL